MVIMILSGMVVSDSGIYTSIDGSYKVYLNKGDFVPQKEGELQILKSA
jgi:hypothetical protein